MKKQLIVIGHLSMLITAILSIYFYKERVLYVDSGLQVYDIINNEKPSILLSRYSLVITQIIPLLAVKLGLPLKYILLSYSISFVAIYYLCYLICIYGYKNITAGISIALVPLILRFAFGAAICEAWAGVVYSCLFYAHLHHYSKLKSKKIKQLIIYYILLLFLILLNYFIHPSTLFTLVFAIVFNILYYKEFKAFRHFFSLIVIILLYAYKFIFPHNGYEESFFTGIKIADQLIPVFYQLPIVMFAKKFFFSNYLIIILVNIFTIALSIKHKKVYISIFTLFFSLIYLIVASISFYKGDAWFMLESRLIPLVFFATIPLLQIIVEHKNNFIYPALLSIVIIFSYYTLSNAVLNVQTKRIKAYEYYINESKKYPEKKFYVFLPSEETITPFNSWGSSHETLMLSSLYGKEESRTINFLYSFQSIDGVLNGYPCVFLGVNYRFLTNEENINKKYFDLKCSKYRELKYHEIP